MKIDSSLISMNSSHELVKQDVKKESLRIWFGDRPSEQPTEKKGISISQGAIKLLFEETRNRKLNVIIKNPEPVKESKKSGLYEVSPQDKLKIELLKRLFEALTGKKFKFFLPGEKLECLDDAKSDKNIDDIKQAAQKLNEVKNNTPQQPQRQGWGLEYDYYESHFEAEKTTFESTGIIKTKDGKEIAFSLEMNMSRKFFEENRISIRAGDAAAKVDPLVINFDGNAAELTSTKFTFDLDSNGQEESISFVKPNSGFLSIDLNNDGKINNGAELFGPQTGNGYEELAKYDEDKNQWIDENDSIYNKLRIWTKDEQGNDYLFALGQKGIGAIYLDYVNTPYDIKTGINESQGNIKATSIYLAENGGVNTTQTLDLNT